MENSNLQFQCSDPSLQQGFEWAKKQALFYSHSGDPVGPWYEAALPGRDAFCIRDTAHQRAGAAALGLGAHNRNMLLRFAKSIAPERDYCMFWEITKNNEPASVDYANDRDFWYNLPANFDMIAACLKEYEWSADSCFLEEEAFLRFYEWSCNEYAALWDKDGDGIPEYYREYGRRGLASYNEQVIKPYIAGDLLGAMFAGYRAYASILQHKQQPGAAAEMRERAAGVQKQYFERFYDVKGSRFYGAYKTAQKPYEKYYNEGNFLPLYFGILDHSPLLKNALRPVLEHGPKIVEAKTYFPQIYYHCGLVNEGYRELSELCNPSLKRREYPEVSFNVISGIVNLHMGITALAPHLLQTKPALSEKAWAKLKGLSVWGGEIDVEQQGMQKTVIESRVEKAFRWKIVFAGQNKTAMINNEKCEVFKELNANNEEQNYCITTVNPGTKAAFEIV